MMMIGKLRNKKWGRVFLALILGTMFFTLLYPDIIATYNDSLSFLDCLWSGKIGEFYETGTPLYLIPIYVIFAAWNMPVWALIRLNICDPYNVICLLWCKGLLVLFFLGSLFYIKKILQTVYCANVDFFIFMLGSSLIFVLPIFAMGQYDIITVFLILLGIEKYIKTNKLTWKVMIVFSVAISLKMFAIFPFIILVLLGEKRLHYIIRDILSGLVISFLSIILYWRSEGFQSSMSYASGLGNRVLITSFEGGIGNISFFMMFAFMIFITAYYWQALETKDFVRKLVWLCGALFFDMFLFVESHPQWMVFMILFFIMLISFEENKIGINALLEMALCVSIVIVQSYLWVTVWFSDQSFQYLALREFVGLDFFGASTMLGFLRKIGLESFAPAFYASFAATGGGLLLINFPLEGKKAYVGCESIEKIESILYVVRPIVLAMYFLITCMIAFVF